MKLAVVANDLMKEELLSISHKGDVELVWLNNIYELSNHRDAMAIFYLLFDGSESAITMLKDFLPCPVIVNSVFKTITDINQPFIRINGWPTFLKRNITEAACKSEENKKVVENIFMALGRKTEWVPDIPGFISARVVAMIINEAYFTLEEKVSTKEEIDTAMKLGTNYPYGPFEWAEKIGIKNIYNLLKILAEKEKRYQPAPLLMIEAAGN